MESNTENVTTISTSTAGNHRASREYKLDKDTSIMISCPNDSATIVSGTATNMLRLVAEAIDLKWFKPATKEIGVMGPAHSTTMTAKGRISDDKHITVVYKPGGAKTEHLYLTPNEDNSTVSEATRLDTTRPTKYVLNGNNAGGKTQGTKDT
ncbi:hypothetical protein GALMADRAFT_142441 [Galerina marginata CBS 339.88]|uniref:Uncharacterized protein n=1 Tax=Galerina marginata (strain CBS 339.88) TaxID=685588 RepID=A0A067T2S1_GALM3|nr:hypothetical protein GALMADRAFT_142441 [Galerina marginata CBS 339.88]